MLKREIRRLHRQTPLDVIVFSGCGEAVGIPSRSLGIPIVYDYVDWFSVPDEIEATNTSFSTFQKSARNAGNGIHF